MLFVLFRECVISRTNKQNFRLIDKVNKRMQISSTHEVNLSTAKETRNMRDMGWDIDYGFKRMFSIFIFILF